MTHTHDLTAIQTAEAIRSRELSPVEVTEHYLDRIDRLNERVGAYVTVTADLAREQARAAEKSVLETPDPNELPPLLGVPVPIKDLNQVAGVRATLGSALYADLDGFLDDHIVERLRDAGTIMVGKTNTPEFGLPCYTENDVAPPARTPWDLARSAGGSSGGAATAVASGLAPAAQGSDGGGSIRIPASACGLFGIKPTRGRISQGPLVPDLFGLSTGGPITRTVRDAALLLDVMTCSRPGDLYSTRPLPDTETFLDHVDREPGRLRIARSARPAVPDAEVHPDVLAAYEDASALLADLGHEVVELPDALSDDLLPHFEKLWAAMACLTPVDPQEEHRLLPLTRWLRDKGNATSTPELMGALTALQAALRTALPVIETFDAVLQPTLALPPVPIGYFHDQDPAENFRRQTLFTPFTTQYNISGQPAVNVPLHWSEAGLPIGVMLAGRSGDEAGLIRLSAQLERARPWADRTPPIWDA